jgi:hypothetical protein
MPQRFLVVVMLCGIALVQSLSARRAQAVDLLPKLDLNIDAVSGTWTKTADGILGDNRDTTAVLRLPYEPGDEYDFEVHFTVLGAGKGTWINLLAPHEGRPGESQNPNGTGDQSELKGWDSHGGVRTHGPLFAQGKTYSLVLKVRRDSVSQFLDNRLITEGTPRAGDRDGPPTHSYAGDRNLGISTLKAKIEIRSIVIRELGRPGAVVVLPPFGDVPSQKEKLPTDKPARIIDVLKLVNPADCAVRGSWMLTDDGLVSPARGDALLRLPYRPTPGEQYDLRASFTRVSGTEDGDLVLSKDSNPFLYVIGGWAGTTCGFAMLDGKNANDNQTMIRSPRMIISNRKYAECICVRRNSVAVYIDGKLVTRLSADFSELSVPRDCSTGGSLGLRSYNSEYVFHSVEVAEITGTGDVSPNGGPALAGARTPDKPGQNPPAVKADADPVTQTAVAFAIAPDLLVTSAAAVKGAAKISIETQDGTRMNAKVVPGKVADGLALVKIEDAHLPSLPLADELTADAVTCMGFPTASMFNSAAQSLPVTTAAVSEPWTVGFETPPRIAGGPLLQNGKVVGVELCTKDSELATIPAATLKGLKSLVGDSAKVEITVPDPAKAVYLLTAEVGKVPEQP